MGLRFKPLFTGFHGLLILNFKGCAYASGRENLCSPGLVLGNGSARCAVCGRVRA